MSIAFLLVLLDFGTPASPAMGGWTAVTPATLAAAGVPGWVDAMGLTAQDKMWPREVENTSAGRMDPPPVYTDDLTRDAVMGTAPAALRVPLPAGEYELWACAGNSLSTRGVLYDFDLSVGEARTQFQMQGSYWFETRKLRFRTAGDATIAITPRSRWILSGLAIYPVSHAAEAAQALAATEQSIYFLPPDLQAEWKEQVKPDPLAQMPPASAADQQRGYLVHHRHYLENVYPATNPYPQELNPTLRAFGSWGEYEPLTFSVRALRLLTGCRVTVSDLKGAGTIPASAVDIKAVQYARSRLNYTVRGTFIEVPDYLRPFETIDVPADRNQRFWLTVQVPDEAPAGLYRGQVTFTPADAPPATVPIEFRVLPIRLRQDPAKSYGMYYRDPLEQAAAATDDYARQFFLRQAELQAQDMNAHGTVLNVPLGAWMPVAKNPAEPNKWELNWDLLAQRIDRCKRYGYGGPYVVSINTGDLYARHMNGERPGSHLRGVKPAPPAFESDMTSMVSFIEQGRKERGLPEFLYYPVDEPGGTPDQVQFMVQCLRAIRAAGARTYVTADPTHDFFGPMKPLVDVWSTQPFLPSHEEVTRDMAARGVEYWCYPNHVNGENDHTTVAGARMTYGFGFWRSGFVALNPWIYSSSAGSPFNNLDGSAADFFNRPGPDGTVWPVPMWEAYREGWDDYRYVYTCQQLIEEARKAGKNQAATAAQQVIDATWQAIEVKAKYKLD
ncbi:MAG: hypothetical protein HUU35_09555, partial [Armatimonadetes bacterium]|nr:hypothetical protein [Armatimonadota bacterium]